MKRILITLLVVLLTLNSCAPAAEPIQPSQSPAAEPTQPSQSPTAASGGILRVSKNADLNTMDPQYATDGLSFEAIAASVDGLFTSDEAGNMVPALATEMTVSEDRLTYTFALRDANWSNGEPVSAHDFVYAWQRLGSAELASEYAYILGVAGIKNADAIVAGEMDSKELGVKAVDDKTLVVELERPVAFFDKLMAFPPFFPANQKFVEQVGTQYGLTPQTMLYCGPFVWTEWISGSSFSFVKNSDYWDADAVKLDGIEFKVALEEQSAVLDFESGNTDYVYLSGELVDRYKDEPGYSIQLGSWLWFLQVNHYDPKLDNENIMMAISLAFNREQIANNVLKDGAIAAEGFVPRKLASDTNGVDFRDTAGKYFTEGKDKAKEYWEAAKTELGVDTFEFELLFEDSEQSKKVAEFMKSEIEETLEGVTVSLKSVPKKTRLEIMRGKENDYHMGLQRWGPDYADPATYLDLYAEPENRGGYSTPEYEALVQQYKSAEISEEDRWQVLLDAEAHLLSNAMGPIPIYQTGAAQMWNPKVKGVLNLTVGTPFLYKDAYFE
ncbi:MAG: peptide ABC transporter substrate-binding protein [Tissierellia bacterium]|nr:peptide ABC transporter substrate-binding protein [Tissierellia bacterium]